MPTRSCKPHDRITYICDMLLHHFDADPRKLDEDRICIFITGEEKSGLVMSGYEDDTEAITDILGHLKVIFEANGKSLMVVPIPQG